MTGSVDRLRREIRRPFPQRFRGPPDDLGETLVPGANMAVCNDEGVREHGPGYVIRAVPSSAPNRPGIDVPIETKLHAPSSRKEWVERRPLIQALAGAAARLILVDAPAGFGKTTLVAQWRCSTIEERSFAWLSLDGADDDPGKFWWHVVCALQRACSGFGGEDILRAIRVQGPDIAGTVLPMLVNELAALPGPVVLVLDASDLSRKGPSPDKLPFLLFHPPPPAPLVLTPRADPPLPLARLRAAG